MRAREVVLHVDTVTRFDMVTVVSGEISCQRTKNIYMYTVTCVDSEYT